MVNNLEKKSPVLFIIGLLCLLSPESRAQDEVHMKVRSEGLRRIVLAVSPFQPSRQTDLGDQLRRIIINDLELSGFFQIIELSDSENKDLLNLRSISRPGNWDLNAAVLLENNFELRGGTISLNSRLQELPTYQQIFEKDFNSSLRTIRQLGHRVADEVTYYLTGDPGIANTKIAFVTVGKTAKEIAENIRQNLEARQDVLYSMVITEKGVAASQVVSSPTALAVFGIAATGEGVVAGQAVVTGEGAAYEVAAATEDEAAYSAGVVTEEGAAAVDAYAKAEDEETEGEEEEGTE